MSAHIGLAEPVHNDVDELTDAVNKYVEAVEAYAYINVGVGGAAVRDARRKVDAARTLVQAFLGDVNARLLPHERAPRSTVQVRVR